MTISDPKLNRPLKFGEQDRRQLLSLDSEVALRCENDANGNPIYVGRAKPGVLVGETKWQIQSIAWDANNSVTSVTWPQNASGNACSDYIFEWDERASYTFS
ncbi:MAG: hypothetical protein R3230_01355 [Nitrosopumilaceae archaeon]|nr:hypothetical protein [Nitrosopumilaceae archaeon]